MHTWGFEATPKWVSGLQSPAWFLLVQGNGRSKEWPVGSLLTLRGGEVGQEPQQGWRGAAFSLPNLTRACVTFEKVWVPVPLPRAPRDKGTPLALFSASWSPGAHPMYHRELSPQNLSKQSVNRIFTPFVQYSEKCK